MAGDAVRRAMLEDAIGLTGHATNTSPLAGRLKVRVDDFVVEEVARGPVPDPEGPITAARLRLANWETNAFVREASHRLGASRATIRFSGTKDKRGVTERWFTFRAAPERVQHLASMAGVEIVQIVRTRAELELGQHEANRFRLVLRHVPHAVDEARRRVAATWNALEALGGAPNVFGPQRFGAQRATTHRVGERIVRGDFEGAVLTYLGEPTALEGPEARGRWTDALANRDWRSALGLLNNTEASFERALLHRLIEGGDALNALQALPTNLQRLFVNAYQSWLFNRLVSRRLQAGLPLNRPVEGDLAAPLEGGRVEETWVPVTKANLDRVAAEARRGRACVTGLLPGTEAPTAEGVMGQLERAVLDEENLKPRDFLVPEQLEWSSKGTRRALLVRPREFDASVEPDALHPGSTQVTFRFALPAGSYATSVLREFMKSPRLGDYA